MAEIRCEHVSKTFAGGVEAVKDFNLNIAEGEFLVLVGPSGCGKSTLLRMIAGLDQTSEGAICIGDKSIEDIPVLERNIAMVFQNYALYPHMTVYDNMAFCLKQEKKSHEEIERLVRNTAERLDITHLLKRKPKTLSGGERQRVAMGRAIIRRPDVFLMDEPLSNLDAQLRNKMRREIAHLHREFMTTTIYVTHDQSEAMSLGDRLVVMNKGVVQQVGSPEEIYQRPANLFVAEFIGSPPINVLSAEIADGCTIYINGSYVRLQGSKWTCLWGHHEKHVHVGIRPEDIRIVDDVGIPCEVIGSEMQGDIVNIFVRWGCDEITVKSQDKSLMKSLPEQIFIDIDTDSLHIYDKTTGLRIDGDEWITNY